MYSTVLNKISDLHYLVLLLRIHPVRAARQGHPGQALVILAMPLEGHPIQERHKGPNTVAGRYQGPHHMATPPPTSMACIRALPMDHPLGVTWGQAPRLGPLRVTWALPGHLQWGTCPDLPHLGGPTSVAP